MAKNKAKAEKAARNLEYANKFRKKSSGPRRSFSGPRPSAPAAPGAAGATGTAGTGTGVVRQRFAAVCSACSAATEVPFQPTEGRRVLCQPCFAKQNPR